MLIVMDMTTGKTQTMDAIAPGIDEFGAYGDEVLNAGWLPIIEPRLETRAANADGPIAPLEPDEFLRNVYRSQE